LVRALVDTTDDAVVGSDRDGRITSWNRSAERISGYRAREVVGREAIELFPEHVQEELSMLFAVAAEGELITRFETEFQRKDGLQVPISMSLCPVFDDDRKLIATVTVARDITEQRLAQARLAEIEERIRESEALAHVGSWLWDVRTDTVQWSHEFHHIHGVDPLDFCGTLDAHFDLLHTDDRVRVYQAMKEAVATGRPFEQEYRVVRPDGEVRQVQARGQPTLDSAGTVVGLRGIGQDVTERRP
jgi:PAS domain S-box-containing protein